jgi:TMEM175 potassium channel family protein
MDTTRLASFSDAVLAIILTIMVLELKVPLGVAPETLAPLLPVLLSYVLSFVYVGIYWSNHHYLLHFSRRVAGTVLWANLHLLFWLSV